MKNTTLCYIEQNGAYLMLHRVTKKNDENHDKWIGVGGTFEDKESPEDCVLREVKEETGLTLTRYRYRGLVTFVSDVWPTEYMHLFTADGFEGEIGPCSEGVLEWVPKDRIFSLPLWEGDRIFLNYLLEDRSFFHLRLHYDRDDRLISDRLLPPVILASASPRRRATPTQKGGWASSSTTERASSAILPRL